MDATTRQAVQGRPRRSVPPATTRRIVRLNAAASTAPQQRLWRTDARPSASGADAGRYLVLRDDLLNPMEHSMHDGEGLGRLGTGSLGHEPTAQWFHRTTVCLATKATAMGFLQQPSCLLGVSREGKRSLEASARSAIVLTLVLSRWCHSRPRLGDQAVTRAHHNGVDAYQVGNGCPSVALIGGMVG